MKNGNAREKIVDAFGKLLIERPLERISVKEVYHVAGVSKSAFYYYFHDMEDLEDAVIDLFLEDWEESIVELSRAGDSKSIPVDIPALARKQYAVFFENKGLFTALMLSPIKYRFCEKFVRVVQDRLNRIDTIVVEEDGTSRRLSRDERRFFLMGLGWRGIGWLQFLVDSSFDYTLDEFVEMMMTDCYLVNRYFARR